MRLEKMFHVKRYQNVKSVRIEKVDNPPLML